MVLRVHGQLILSLERQTALAAAELVNVTLADRSQRRRDARSVAAERRRLQHRNDVKRTVCVVVFATVVVGKRLGGRGGVVLLELFKNFFPRLSEK